MSRIKGSNDTKPEMVVHFSTQMGFRFRLHAKDPWKTRYCIKKIEQLFLLMDATGIDTKAANLLIIPNQGRISGNQNLKAIFEGTRRLIDF